MAYFEIMTISTLYENTLNMKTGQFQNTPISAFFENEVISACIFQAI